MRGNLTSGHNTCEKGINRSVISQDWETETLDIDMGRISNDDDLGLDLAGGR